MKIIVCLDDKGGMLFNKRRQSSDRLLRERVLRLTAGSRLWMNAYSKKQFTEETTVFADEQFLEKAVQGDYCFVENTDILPFADKIETMIVYRWNTVYPADVRFPLSVLDGKRLISTDEFEGYSHKRITEEIYEW